MGMSCSLQMNTVNVILLMKSWTTRLISLFFNFFFQK